MAYGASNGADMSFLNGVDARHGMPVWHRICGRKTITLSMA